MITDRSSTEIEPFRNVSVSPSPRDEAKHLNFAPGQDRVTAYWNTTRCVRVENIMWQDGQPVDGFAIALLAEPASRDLAEKRGLRVKFHACLSLK